MARFIKLSKSEKNPTWDPKPGDMVQIWESSRAPQRYPTIAGHGQVGYIVRSDPNSPKKQLFEIICFSGEIESEKYLGHRSYLREIVRSSDIKQIPKQIRLFECLH